MQKIKIGLISGSAVWNAIKFVFILYVQVEVYQNILILRCWPHAFNFFKKQKKVWNKSPCLISCLVFEEIYFSDYILLADQFSLRDCLHFLRYWAVCVLFVVQSLTSYILKVTLAFLSICFSSITKKSEQKCKNLKNKKRFYYEIKSIFTTF